MKAQIEALGLGLTATISGTGNNELDIEANEAIEDMKVTVDASSAVTNAGTTATGKAEVLVADQLIEVTFDRLPAEGIKEGMTVTFGTNVVGEVTKMTGNVVEVTVAHDATNILTVADSITKIEFKSGGLRIVLDADYGLKTAVTVK